jgi:hypothetical protein
VRPYVRRNKTDRTDAKGLLEANRNEDIPPVPVKSIAHHAIASLHGRRSTWLATRTARLNTIRGLLREFGIFIPIGAHHVGPRVHTLLAAPTTVPILLHPMLQAACSEIDGLEANLRAVERQLAAVASDMEDVTLLQTGPGVGLLTATALVALVSDIRRFPSGRHFASVLGLTPRADSSALRRRLGAISKQGDVYLRMLLTHGRPSCGIRRPPRPPRRCRAGRFTPSSAGATTSPLSRWRINSPGSCGPSGRTTAPSPLKLKTDAPPDRVESALTRRMHRAHVIMAHRSDRRGDEPIPAVALEAVPAIGSPRADSHDGPERLSATPEADDTSAV